MWHTGLVAPQHVGSSQTRARTHVPCTGRQILNHCATREACLLFLICFSYFFSACDLSFSLSLWNLLSYKRFNFYVIKSINLSLIDSEFFSLSMAQKNLLNSKTLKKCTKFSSTKTLLPFFLFALKNSCFYYFKYLMRMGIDFL